MKYCPYKFKYELINWLITYKQWSKTNATKLSKKQLYAIWYRS